MIQTKSGNPLRAAGFSLVEIMIALLIGMIAIVVIMQVYAASEGYKRTSTNSSDAQVNGALALYLLEREIRLAGYGMNGLAPAGCTSIRVWNDNAGTGVTLRLVPFEINPAGVPAGDPNTDVLTVSYGSSDTFPTGVPADQPANSSANFKVSVNRDSFRNGDLVIAVQPGAGPGGGTSCVMNEITGVPGSGGNCGSPPTGGSDVLEHNTGKYKDPNIACEMKAPTHNNASGIKDENGNTVPKLTSSTGGQLFNIGALPQIKAYAIRNANLTVCDVLNQDCNNMANWSVMVSNIVSLRAIYGQDKVGGDGAVDTWNRDALATGADVLSVLAAGVQVTARSGLKEKSQAGGACDVTKDAAYPDAGAQKKAWYAHYLANSAASIAGAAIDLSTVSADWQCYRYKLFQTAVPLRNMIWRPA